MSRRPRWLRLLVVLGVVALVAAISSPASGGSIQGGDPRLPGDQQAVVDRDTRTGRKAPSSGRLRMERPYAGTGSGRRRC
jgi:hypothetical protein